MMRRSLMLSLLIGLAQRSAADDAAAVNAVPPVATEVAAQTAAVQPAANTGGTKKLSGISILGNQEAPKALVIVPWKGSQIGDALGLDENLDDSRRPVDKDVFMRELDYYDIRSGSK